MAENLAKLGMEDAAKTIKEGVADFQKGQAPALVQKLMENNVPFVYRVFGDKVNKLGHVFHCDIKTIDAAQCNDAECDFFREFCF